MPGITRELAIYNDIHRHPVNRMIHAIGIPIIMFSVAGLAGFAGVGGSKWQGYVINGGSLLALISGYIIGRYSIRSGIALTLFSFALSFAAHWMLLRFGASTALAIFVGCFVVGWAIQFAGHAVEGAGPAFGARPLNLLLGPVAVLNEILPLDRPSQGTRRPI